jgi:hypothetical protein
MTTATMREYRHTDKSTWGHGPWDAEPDKRQWVDEATGYDCLAVRANGGHWCGYVGVPESHPWHGVGYSACGRSPACGEEWCEHAPEHAIRVHGGLTYAAFCQEPTPEQWEKIRAHIPEARAQAALYPEGDSARWLASFLPFADDYEGWAAAQEGRAICHVPLPGRPARVWWFGFDCAHFGDQSPAYAARDMPSFSDGAYRDLAYVEAECAAMARQLADVAGAAA